MARRLGGKEARRQRDKETKRERGREREFVMRKVRGTFGNSQYKGGCGFGLSGIFITLVPPVKTGSSNLIHTLLIMEFIFVMIAMPALLVFIEFFGFMVTGRRTINKHLSLIHI